MGHGDVVGHAAVSLRDPMAEGANDLRGGPCVADVGNDDVTPLIQSPLLRMAQGAARVPGARRVSRATPVESNDRTVGLVARCPARQHLGAAGYRPDRLLSFPGRSHAGIVAITKWLRNRPGSQISLRKGKGFLSSW